MAGLGIDPWAVAAALLAMLMAFALASLLDAPSAEYVAREQAAWAEYHDIQRQSVDWYAYDHKEMGE